MSRRFYYFPSFVLKHLRRFKALKLSRPTVIHTSLLSIALASAHFFEPLTTNSDTSEDSFGFITENESTSDHVLVRLFEKFATIEVEGEAFMTPRDFVDCVTGARPPVKTRRQVMDICMAERLLTKTPHISSGCSALFRILDRNGLISCSEYLFLLSILTHNSYNLSVLFRMFDRDSSESIEKSEFLQIIALCNMKFQKGKLAEERVPKCSTTIQRHFFHKNGGGRLLYNDFLKFINDLQEEVLRTEFYRLSSGKDTISPLQLAQVMLRYADISEKDKEKGLEHVAESINFNEDSIDFKSYCVFFNLLFRYEDLYSALKMFLLSNRAISREEFQRAARAVTGRRLNDAVVNTVFLLFDADGDGHLSADEFISAMRSYLSRGTRGRLVDENRIQSFTSCVGTKMRGTR